jgi:hypothetical protein
MKLPHVRLLSLLLVLLCVGSSIAMPIAAQPSYQTSPDRSTASGEQAAIPVSALSGQPSSIQATTSAGNNSSNNESGGGGMFSGLPDFSGPKIDVPNISVPSTEEIVNATLRTVADDLNSTSEPFVSEIVNLTSGMPAPGVYNRPLTWMPGLQSTVSGGSADNPESVGDRSARTYPVEDSGGIWNDVYSFWTLMMGIAAIIFTISGMWLFTSADPHQFKEGIKTWAIGFLMAAGTWLVAPLGLHIGRQMSFALAPSAQDLASTWFGVPKLSLGIIVFLVLAAVQFGILGIALFTIILEYALVHIVVGFWPVAWALRTTRSDSLRSVGSTVIYLYGFLIAIYIGQAALLRFAFMIDWAGAGGGSWFGSLFAFIVTLLVFAIALLWMPKKLLTRALAAGTVGLGVRSAQRGVRRYSRRGNAIARLNEWRSDDGGDGSSEPAARGTRNDDKSPSGSGDSDRSSTADGDTGQTRSRGHERTSPSGAIANPQTDGGESNNDPRDGASAEGNGEQVESSTRTGSRYGQGAGGSEGGERQSSYDSRRTRRGRSRSGRSQRSGVRRTSDAGRSGGASDSAQPGQGESRSGRSDSNTTGRSTDSSSSGDGGSTQEDQ